MESQLYFQPILMASLLEVEFLFMPIVNAEHWMLIIGFFKEDK